jgi:hypothetical protein
MWNTTLLMSVPLGVVTVMYPLEASFETVASMYVSETTVKLSGVPFKAMAIVPVNPCPRIPPLSNTWPYRTEVIKRLQLAGGRHLEHRAHQGVSSTEYGCAVEIAIKTFRQI